MKAETGVRRLESTVALLLVATGLVLYSFNLNGPLFWDDYDLVLHNQAVQQPAEHLGQLLFRDMLAGSGQVSNYYRPVQMLSYALNWQLGGPQPWGYHLLSNLLHIGSAVLLFQLLLRILGTVPLPAVNQGAAARIITVTVAAASALFWLIHPVQAEAVAYVAGRGDPLSVLFTLASLCLWLAADERGRVPGAGSAMAYRSLAMLCAVLALGSRETAVLLPIYLTAIYMTSEVEKGGWASLASGLRRAWPLYLLSAAYVLLRLTALNFDDTLNFHHAPNPYSENVSVRVWTFLAALTEYVRIALLPWGLHFEHTVPWALSPWRADVLFGAAIVILSLLGVVMAWRRGYRVIFLAAVLFFVPFAPSSGILAPINNVFSEHWLYLNLAGLGLGLSIGVAGCVHGNRSLRRMVLVLSGVYLGYLGLYAVERNRIVTEPERLYLQVLEYEPGNVRVLNNLAGVHARRGDLDAAEKYWKAAADADPTQSWPLSNLADLARNRGDHAQAERLYLEAIRVRPERQRSYRNLAGMLLELERWDHAREVLEVLINMAPGEAVLYHALARAWQGLGRNDTALATLDAGEAFVRSAEARAAFDQLRAELQ
ncbi:MAG: tetratricopeptide repeat protein [Xanthomonadales bacterium]|nr:tetratricopeptide repeat protein [Xanthomonadales bacterium]